MDEEPRLQLSDASIGVVTALPQEYAAAKVILGCHQETVAPGRGAGRTFALGRMPAKHGGSHVVAVALLLDMGNNMAAAAATTLLQNSPVEHIIMCGIAGAVPHPDKPEHHVRLGDIVVSDRGGVIQYDLDKESSDEIEFRNPPRPPSAQLLDAVRHLEADSLLDSRPWEAFLDGFVSTRPEWERPPTKYDQLKDWEDEPAASHPGRSGPTGRPMVFLGPIASANKLLKNPSKRNMLRDRFKVKAVEMEGSGIADATWQHSVGYLVVRGTCDYCNSDKGDGWQKYASVVAAAYTRAVIEAMPAEPDTAGPPSGHPALPQKILPEPHERRTLLTIDDRAKPDHWPDHVPADLANIVSKLGSNTSLFDKDQGSVTIDASKLGDDFRLNVQWAGTDVARSSGQTTAEHTVPEPAALAIRSFLESIGRSRKQRDFAAAADVANELAEWLKTYEPNIPAQDVCEAYIALAEIEQIQLALAKEQGKQSDDSTLRNFIERALQVNLPRSAESTAKHLAGLQAHITATSSGTEAALSELGTGTDPETMRYRLTILLDAERFEGALNCALEKPLHTRWCELAVIAFARTERDDLAAEAITWCEQAADPSLRRRCILRFASVRYLLAFRDRSPESSILPGELEDEERTELANVLSILDPLLQAIKANRRVDTQLECEVLQLAIKVSTFLCNMTAAGGLVDLLVTYQPVPLDLAELALGRWVSPPENLPDKLRSDHSGVAKALILADLIEGEFFGKSKEAFDAILRRRESAVSQHEEELFCTALFQLAQQAELIHLAQAREAACSLLGDRHPLVFQHDVAECLRNEAFDKAKALLESRRDEESLIWLQMYASFCQATGDGESALEYFERASRIAPHPSLLKTVAEIGFNQGHFRTAVDALEKKLKMHPDDASSNRNLAILYARLHEYENASRRLAKLRDLGTATVDDDIDYGGCLANSGNRTEALAVYDELCALDAPPIVAIVGKSRLLKSLNRPKEAFRFLHEIRGDYWDQPDFLLAYWDLGQAADEEYSAHLAFERLLDLQQAGRTQHEYLQPKRLEDFVEYAEDFRERRSTGFRKILTGSMPWLLVDTTLGSVPYWAWRLRTQDVDWISEDPLECASYAIYSTNGYAVARKGQVDAQLLPLECPASETEIVADLSALLTLHRLDMLDQAAEYFGRILVPAEYMVQALADSEQLIPHQLSRKGSLEAIRDALDSDRLYMADESDVQHLPFVHEHTTDEPIGHVYRLVDLVDAMDAAGQIDDDLRSHLASVTKKPSGTDSEHPTLSPSTAIRVALSALRTLHNFRALEPLLETFQVTISKGERDEIDAGLRAFRAQENVRRWHDELWEYIRDDSRFLLIPGEADDLGGTQTEADSLPNDASLLAAKLADNRKLPLLADDRFCQMLALNKHDAALSAAFSTERLLMTLADSGQLPITDAADCVLRLVTWRYRFILPSAAILKAIADRNTERPPGKDLRDIARYMHDCMRDPGLFAGPEPTDPPLPVAFRIHQDWAMTISRFLVDAWADEENWSVENAILLTNWVIREFLPSAPGGLGAIGVRLASFVPETVLTQALIHSVQIRNAVRANEAMRTIASRLGVNAEDYEKLVVKVLDVL